MQNMNTIRILYFARLREAFGCAEESVTLPANVQNVADLIAWLAARGGVWSEELGGKRVFRVAINQDMAGAAALIPPGAELAIFPPVTGG